MLKQTCLIFCHRSSSRDGTVKVLRETFRRLIGCTVHVRSLTERDIMSLALTPSSTPTSALCEEDVNDVIAELGLPNTRRRHRQICDMLGGGGGEPAVKKARRDSLQARDPSVFCAEYSDDSDTESYDDTAPPQPPSPSPQTIAVTAERRSEQSARASFFNFQRLKRALETVTVNVAPDDDNLDSMTDVPDLDCQIIAYDATTHSKPVNRESVIKQEQECQHQQSLQKPQLRRMPRDNRHLLACHATTAHLLA